MIKRFLWLSLLIIVSSGCATRQVQTLANLPLPADQSRSCCWQALQQVEISYNKQTYTLTGALAQTSTGVTLVLFDPFGRRLLSINKHGETITSYRSPELPASLPERFLLASSMLVWWPLLDWQNVLAAKTGWHMTIKDSQRILGYGNHIIMRATYEPNSSALVEGMSDKSIGQAVTLTHEHQPLSIKVITQTLDHLSDSNKRKTIMQEPK